MIQPINQQQTTENRPSPLSLSLSLSTERRNGRCCPQTPPSTDVPSGIYLIDERSRGCPGFSPSKPRTPKTMSRTLNRIEDWLEKAERAKYGITELAESCGVSRRQLRRYFEVHCGISPHQWLNEVRMWKSLPLLLESKHISSIAYNLGFERTTTFAEVFRRHFGCSPREFIVNPDKTLERVIAKKPGLLEADGSIPVDELSKLARRSVEFVRREKK
jgi:AraC-like DNA-binding protein